MNKNKKILDIKRAIFIIGSGIFLFFASLSSAAEPNPNYGTTTFFSNKKEKPVLEKPILGASDDSDGETNHNNGNDDDDEDDDEDGGGIVDPGTVLNNIGNTIDAVVDSSINVYKDAKKSLFDMQSDDFGGDNSSGDDGFNSKDEFFIAGPRGESPEYMAMQMKNSDKRTIEFNFEDTNLKVAPKKSKLIFTNKEVAIDMTSQYVAITFIFILATGSAVGYYYLQRGTIKGKEEDYD